MKKKTLDTVSCTIYVPKQLKEAIDSISLTKTRTNQCYNLVSLVQTKSRETHKVATDYVPMSSSYLKLVFTEKYYQILNPLKEAGIIESDEKFQFGAEKADNNKCLFYRVNPKYFQSEDKYIPLKYTYKMFVTDEDHPTTNLYHQEHKELVESLKIDFVGMREMIEEMIANTKSPKEVQKMQVYWLGSLANLEKGSLYARRNKTNLRLDTNFTNMKKLLRDKINKDNDYVEVDLTASQYCVLSLLMQRDGIVDADALNFYSLCEKGQLYEYLSDELEIDRERVKKLMFFVSFSELHKTSVLKDRFALLFPSVMGWINETKKRYGYVEVSKLLQSHEATIFIDGIKTDLMGAVIPNYTVHDSVNVPREDLDKTLYIMEYHMKEAGLKGVLKVDGIKRKGEHIGSPLS